MPRAADLDIGDIDASRGKQAEMLTPAGKQSRDLERAGLRDLDQRTENLPGLTRHKKDLNRTMPRDGTGPSVRPRRLPQGPARHARNHTTAPGSTAGT